MRAMMAGFQVHLSKPVQIGELVIAIHSMVRHRDVDATVPGPRG